MYSRIATAAVITALCAALAQGQGFPSKPVRIVNPYPISGPTDIRGTARMTKTYKLIAQHTPPAISDQLAALVAQAIRSGSPQPVLLERQPGGITTRGALTVARSEADGHTLLLASNATMIINPNYFHGVEYDPMRDFVLVAPLATMPFVLMVNSSLPVAASGSLQPGSRCAQGKSITVLRAMAAPGIWRGNSFAAWPG